MDVRPAPVPVPDREFKNVPLIAGSPPAGSLWDARLLRQRAAQFCMDALGHHGADR
jgi:hypothetical protein